MHRIFSVVRWFLEKITHKRLFYTTPNKHNALGKTAAWCDIGFWYVGNVYDSADIAYGIAQNGAVEEAETTLVLKILSDLREKHPDLTVYDIGANTGYYGILAATKFGANTHSFEPLDEHASCIRESARMNGVADKVIVHTIALGSRKDELQIAMAGSGSTLSTDFLGKTTATTHTVSVETLDSLNLPAPHFIKIDVEGYEWEVLQGARTTISCHKPICFIEVARTFSKRNFIHSHFADIITFFHEQGYQVKRNTTSGLVDIETIPDGVAMYLCIPNY